MKKIFAIALALVMVLSMASAFAFVGKCGDYAWTCSTVGCGVAKAEVVTFVANNTLDMYQESSCAAVVVNQPIFYGVKVTFDKDVNKQWYYHVKTQLNIKESNVTNGMNWKSIDNGNMSFYTMTGDKAADASGTTYWVQFNSNGTPEKLVSTFDPTKCVKKVIASNTRAEVSANVLYDFNGVTRGSDANLTYHNNLENLSDEWIDYGDFKVRVYKNAGGPGKIEYAITVNQGSNYITVWVIGGVAKYVTETNAANGVPTGEAWYSSFDGTTFKGIKGTLDSAYETASGTETSTAASCSIIDDLMALINISLGNCVNSTTIKNIFGWENGSANKATWNKDAVAIANAACQVAIEIPKTGDASVIAYAVMALVAAAGAMGLKK